VIRCPARRLRGNADDDLHRRSSFPVHDHGASSGARPVIAICSASVSTSSSSNQCTPLASVLDCRETPSILCTVAMLLPIRRATCFWVISQLRTEARAPR
jgi:hypothetical protein